MPLSDELWRPISWSCLRGLLGGRLPPPWPEGRSFSGLCNGNLALAWPALSGWFEVDSVQMVSRLPMLQSDWLVSDASEEPDMLRSSPPADGQYDASSGAQQTSALASIEIPGWFWVARFYLCCSCGTACSTASPVPGSHGSASPLNSSDCRWGLSGKKTHSGHHSNGSGPVLPSYPHQDTSH